MSSEYPSFTQIPNFVLDDWLPDLTGTELKVLLYIMRRTAGFGKEWDAISLSQFLKGISSSDGGYKDRGCGVGSRPHVLEALASLEQRGLIQIYKERSHHGGALTNLYRYLVPIRNQGVVPIGNQGSSVMLPRVVPDRHPQKKDLQNKERQEAQEQPSEQLAVLWQQVLVTLAAEMSKTNFTTWLGDTVLLQYQEQTAVIGVPTKHQLGWLEQRMKLLIEKALRTVTGQTISTKYRLLHTNQAVS